MSLENLERVGQLEKHETDAAQARKLLDSFRVKRNAISYTGEDMDTPSVEACIAAGDQLMQYLSEWLIGNRPDLIK